MADIEQPDVTALTVQLLSAYLANNIVAHTDIAELVRATKAALVEDKASAPVEVETPAHAPAVTARKSLAASGHILSLIDGKPYKTLKRHLSKHGLTPQAYRERYNLPATYPMVAPDFAAERRAIAKKIGLGRRAAPAVSKLSEEAPDKSPASAAPAKPAGRKATASTAKTAPKKAPASLDTTSEANGAAGKPSRKGGRVTLKLFTPKDGAAKAAGSKPGPKKSPGRPKKPVEPAPADATVNGNPVTAD
ncbi:MucR family transcriptional regulator [Sphingobium sp. AN558]|uniref:MucR family transcriptional regulator n=1 Tax=Sphingobium sp. AN558 TaxID=3133442 RepID=UPI0030C193E4